MGDIILLVMIVIGEPPREFHDAIEALAHVFSNRVSEYIMGDLESVSVSSTGSSKTKSSENLASGGGTHGPRSGNGMHQGNSNTQSMSPDISNYWNLLISFKGLFHNKSSVIYTNRASSWP